MTSESLYLSEAHAAGGVYAKVVAASVSQPGNVQLYTLETCAPKFLDAEFEKHRMLSSNSSSSRAIPFRPLERPFLPPDVRLKSKGMQGYEKLDDKHLEQFHNAVRHLYSRTVEMFGVHTNGDIWNEEGWHKYVHKQHLNRYLEPWTLQKKVITATEWDNFFNLRLAKDVQPEMRSLAECMHRAICSVQCVPLQPGQWHLPYIRADEEGALLFRALAAISAARCARVSYSNHDNSAPDRDKDLALYHRLISRGHWTPLEHQAYPMGRRRDRRMRFNDPKWEPGVTHSDRHRNLWSGNFRGWVQFRQLLNEWNARFRVSHA